MNAHHIPYIVYLTVLCISSPLYTTETPDKSDNNNVEIYTNQIQKIPDPSEKALLYLKLAEECENIQDKISLDSQISRICTAIQYVKSAQDVLTSMNSNSQAPQELLPVRSEQLELKRMKLKRKLDGLTQGPDGKRLKTEIQQIHNLDI